MTDKGAPTGTRTDRYGGVARFFHWTIAALIVLQFVLAELGEMAEDGGERARQLALLANHKSVGMTVLALALLRVGWRLFNTPPELPLAMPNWQRVASFFSHWSLYLLLFALPLSGWLMSSAAAYSVSWFGLFTWPDLVEPSKALRGVMHDVHEVLGKLLFVVAVIHVAAALKHHLFDRDDVLRRMSSVASYLLFFGVIVAGAWGLTRTGGDAPAAAADVAETAAIETPADAAEAGEAPADDAAAEPAAAVTDDAPPPAAAAADNTDDNADGGTDAAPPARDGDPAAEAGKLEPAPDAAATTNPPAPVAMKRERAPEAPEWRVDYGDSFIEFTAEQAGAPFTGRWTDWSADMQFAPDALGSSAFDVAITVGGVETGDDDRDATIGDPEFFDAGEHPVVRFRTTSIRADGDGFVSPSTLTVKGVDHPVTFRFDVTADGDRRVLEGSARLDRLALDVGTGEWADTEAIGQFVDVSVRVTATVSGN